MGDRSRFFTFPPILAHDEAAELEARRQSEQKAAEARAFHAAAYLCMPEYLRSQSIEWGMPALMEAVWMNGFESGYKQSMRDEKTETPK
jgi:hypothetical protein